MAETPAIPAFSGDSWDQCSTLIHAVRNAAYREGKIRDQGWMADLASVNFMGEALAWYARLPRDVQEDWSKLQVALANRWSTQKGEFAFLVQAFSGDSWDECSRLIHGVRDAAWREGKIQDQVWMANFASIHFTGEALAWYARLPRDVQEDWSKLQAALANRWSTPDAAASEDVTATDRKFGYLACGLLKAVDNKSGATFYVRGARSTTWLTLTENVREAARFRFESQSSSTLLEFVDPEGYLWFAVHWHQSNRGDGQGTNDWGETTMIDPQTMKSLWGSSNPFQVASFRFLSSGEVVPTWRDGNTKTDLTGFSRNSYIHMSPNPEVYGRHYSSGKRLSFYIEKIEE